MTAYLPFLFQSIGQVTVGIGEVGLKLDGTSVCVDGQVYQPEQRVQIITTRQKQCRCTGETGWKKTLLVTVIVLCASDNK